MARVYIVCGGTGAGKTTHAIALAQQHGAVRFSIDPWMLNLFGADMPEPLRFDWIAERVLRCEAQIWAVAEQVLSRGCDVVLDLGFMRFEQRERHRLRARTAGAEAVLHFVDTPREQRIEQVRRRNQERDPATFAFEVTQFMFDFVEPQLELPDSQELVGGSRISRAPRRKP